MAAACCNKKSCTGAGPGYATPLDAVARGPREKLLYIPAIVPSKDRPDYLATVDVDPDSSTYGQVIARTPVPYNGDELHHTSWNACSSCFLDATKTRFYLVAPTLQTGRVYGFDVTTDPRKPTLEKIVEPEEIQAKTGLSFLHTSHCLGTGEVLISALGDAKGNGRGGFVLLDHETFEVKGSWEQLREGEKIEYGYDFWYQPHFDVLISTAWGAPAEFFKGFDPSKVPTHYGDQLYFWSWKDKTLKQKISLGPEGLIPLEVRFLHNPFKPHGFVGAALSSNVIHFTQDADSGEWKTNVAVKQAWTKVEGFVLPELPPLITDILISLDDKWLYFSNWLRGDIAQYDISDPANPKFVSRMWVGGLIRKGSPIKAIDGLPEDTPEAPEVPAIGGRTLDGGPQMLQLSLDGKRLYVTSSLFSPWDKQFYPDLVKNGAYLLKIDVDNVNGGLALDTDFIVDFGKEPDGPVLAHEIRYPGGDSSSDIWVVETADPKYIEAQQKAGAAATEAASKVEQLSVAA